MQRLVDADPVGASEAAVVSGLPLDEEIERTRKAMDLTPKKDAGQPAATHRYNMQTGQIEEIK